MIEEKNHLEDKEDEIVLYIKKFFDKNGFGPRSKDLLNEFTPSLWSSKNSLFTHIGKLLDQGIIIKKADPKKAIDRYSRYYVSESYEKEVKKTEILNDLKENDLSEIDITKIIYNEYYSRAKTSMENDHSLNLVKYLKPFEKQEEEFFNKYCFDLFAKKMSNYFKINISYERGQKPPNLDIRLDNKNTPSGNELIARYFIRLVGEYEREIGEKRPLQLILTFNPDFFDREDLIDKANVKAENLYNKWLLEFNQQYSEETKKEFDRKLASYIRRFREKQYKLN